MYTIMSCASGIFPDLFFCPCPVLQDGETAVILAAQKGHKELLLRLVNHYKCAAREKDSVSP